MGGKSKKSKSTGKSKPKVNRARQKLKAKIAGKTLKGKLAANFSSAQLSSLKKQHESFKSHRAAGTLSTHQKAYSTGPFAKSGAERAQALARAKLNPAPTYSSMALPSGKVNTIPSGPVNFIPSFNPLPRIDTKIDKSLDTSKLNTSQFSSWNNTLAALKSPAVNKLTRTFDSAKNWYNTGKTIGEDTRRFGNFGDLFAKDTRKVNSNTLFGNDRLQRGQSNINFQQGKQPSWFGRPDRSVLGIDIPESIKNRKLVTVSAAEGGPGSAPTPLARQVLNRGLPFVSKLYSGLQIFGQGQTGSLTDQGVRSIPNVNVSGLSIGHTSPESTDIGARSWNAITQIPGRIRQGAENLSGFRDITNWLSPHVKRMQTTDEPASVRTTRKPISEKLSEKDTGWRDDANQAIQVGASYADLLGKNKQLDWGDIRNVPGAINRLTSKPDDQIKRLRAGVFGGDLFGIPNYVASNLLAKGLDAAVPNQDPNNWFSNRYPDTARTLTTLGGLESGEAGKHINTLRDLAAKYTGVKKAVTNPLQTIKGIFQPSSRGGKLRIQDVDPNKMGSTYNPYLQSGQAAQDNYNLASFWQTQDQINAAAEQRLKDIQSDRSSYSNLLTSLDTQGKAYTDELTRIRPIGDYYSSELTRLQPFDKQFSSTLADYTKGRDELRGYQSSGDYTHPDDVKYLNEQLPQYDKAIADLETQYKGYQTSISDLTKGQKDYQSYLGDLQTSQTELGTYKTDVTKRQSDLEDYSKAFTSAKQASDLAAKSYTVQAQQNISGGLRSGVSGIRTGGGIRTIGSSKDKSAKRRFNRDFRIGSFGDTSMSPINV